MGQDSSDSEHLLRRAAAGDQPARAALRDFEGLSNREAAKVLGSSKTAANNRSVRALVRLRDLLDRVPGCFEEG